MSFSLFDNGEFELESRFSPQQSFYNKASVIVSTDGRGGVTATWRHIREFFKQAGLKADSKAQCLRDYVREVD